MVEADRPFLVQSEKVVVSIPERVLSWLKLDVRKGFTVLILVSIPERVLSWLKRDEESAILLEAIVFQSLKGF